MAALRTSLASLRPIASAWCQYQERGIHQTSHAWRKGNVSARGSPLKTHAGRRGYHSSRKLYQDSASYAARPSASATSTSTPTAKPAATSSAAPSYAPKTSAVPSYASKTYATPAPPAPAAVSPSSTASSSSATTSTAQFLTEGLNDAPVTVDGGGDRVDWARSFHGLSAQPFDKDVADILLKPITAEEVEVKADGIVYLPEIKYRRILNRAFGPGGWGLAPRSETIVTDKAVTREYALVAHGRLVSVARGEQDYFSPEGIPTATEGCKSNAMMRCCKDLGIASELWDPQFIRKFMVDHAKEIFVEHAVTKRRRKIWMRKDDQPKYPYKEAKSFGT